MKKIGPVIEQLLRRHNLWQGYQQVLIIESWDRIVGSQLSEVTIADRFNNGVLRVKVKDSVWAYHLTMLKPQLVKKLNHFAGGNIIKDIFFSIEEPDKKDN